MSYNIDHVETNVLKASMRAGDIVDLYEDFEGELAEGNFLEEHLATAERLCRNGIEDELVKLDNLWWYGEGSGRSYKDVFLKHLAPKIQGEVEAVFVWEGGDSHTGLAIEDGVVIKCDVELRVIRPEAKAKSKGRKKPKALNVDAILEQTVKAVVGAADYDLAKNLDVETAEEPEYVEADLAKLVDVAREHLRPLLLPGGSQK